MRMIRLIFNLSFFFEIFLPICPISFVTNELLKKNHKSHKASVFSIEIVNVEY